MGSVDEFLAGLSPGARSAFERVRQLAESVVPEAEQGSSYGVAALRYRGKPLIGFADAKTHLSVFPFSPAVVAQVRDRLAGYSVSKGTIRFSEDHPLPAEVVSDIVRFRRDEISGTNP
jgi:uncharacterized protein YdhG (YjbR/CyaY superfamily)